MPKKQQNEPPDEKSKRFVEDAQRMIDAGELNPIEAEKGLERALRPITPPQSQSEQR